MARLYSVKTIRPFHVRDDTLIILDQRLLPQRMVHIPCRTAAQVAAAIRDMAVRGAPAIGIAAAYGYAFAVRDARRYRARRDTVRFLADAERSLLGARPTAVNLAWAVQRVRDAVRRADAGGLDPFRVAMIEAAAIWHDEVESNRRISVLGAGLLRRRPVVLTHCNAGALATGGEGTALGIITEAHRRGYLSMVYVDETRPCLQGARLTMLELTAGGVPATLITDGMAAHVMQTRRVAAVVVGADRIAANGDTANKVGTRGLAVLAHYHRIPLYVAAPMSTVDPRTAHGGCIAIEERHADEVRKLCGRPVAPPHAAVFNPGFDVTPAHLISAIITEWGVFRPPFRFGHGK